MEDLFDGFPVTMERPVLWGEMDAYQHVNNTAYFRYFEDVRIAYFERIGIAEIKEAEGVGPILASTACRFRLPLTHPDSVILGARVSRWEDDRFVMRYRVVSRRHGKVAAEGEGTLVAFDYRGGRKSRYPEVLRERIVALEGGVLRP